MSDNSENSNTIRDNSNIIREELNLLLIYLTGWEEEKKSNPDQKVFRSWKGYRFEVMARLEKLRYIYQIPGGKSLILTEEGKKKVEQLKRKYLGFAGPVYPVMSPTSPPYPGA